MSIDGAKELKEVGYAAWKRLAAEIRFAPRFLEQRMAPFVERVREAVPELAAESEHSHEIVREIATSIAERAERLVSP